ncbi:type IV pilin protein [Tenacibaculum jejuense]|uniref:Putative bacterial general secretion pathway protein G n=1 Tax=Tenacibaculum jejuense TaxID=584609 RepID=A0A238U8D6_9FLAO|nr:type II secretion system protein [Tenacibaculum jejuense]SNR15453.1 putative bacterial general secretion pathway protein G [Tenacibaculum jejuense]
MKLKFLKKKTDAFNLQELLVVMVIVGILVLIALPNLMKQVTKSKSMEAKIQLTHLHGLQKDYYYINSKYSNNFNDIDFEAPNANGSGNNVYYSYEIIEASKNSFKARATAIEDFDGDGVKNVWEIDQNKNLKEIVRD